MDFIEALLWFILGIVFDAWIRPLIDSLVNLFNSIIDSNTAKNQIKIAKANEQIQSLQEPVGNSNVIGF
ncbi:MAG: hypothetical protein SOX92_06745 [Candidatus Onthovivens sp.]|nr:hypothetical protein [Candidatus Onthovivens sp.]